MEQEKFESVIREKLGIRYLRPYQTLIIRHILDNEERGRRTMLLASLPTGSGKTLCFTAPMLLMKGITVCIYPLLALISDQERRFSECGFNPVILKGGLGREERKRRILSLRDGKSLLLVTNIEMLLHLMKSGEMEPLRSKIETLVIDEVHTILEWGETFRPSFLEINDIISYLEPRNIFAFSATITSDIGKKIISLIFSGIKPYIVHGSVDRENIFYHSIRTLSEKHDVLKILSHKEMRPSLVFCSSREGTQLRAREAERSGLSAKFYHAHLSEEEKKETEKWFFSSSDGVLFATIAYGMGVSKDNIRSVIHTFLPPDASSFLQESGRSGRDGKEAHSFILYSPLMKSPLLPLFSGTECIRRLLLEEMNEEVENRQCLMCSHCTPDSFRSEGENEILGFLDYWGLMSQRLLARSLQRFSLLSHSFRLRNWTEKEIGKAIEILLKEGKIRKIGPFLAGGRRIRKKSLSS